MIVIVKDRYGDESFLEDIAAVVRNDVGNLYLCRDGQPDEYLDDTIGVVVVNDG